MARQKTTVEQRNFVRGIITEANPLTFPENASIDEQNFEIGRDGSRRRRLGLDKEPDGVERTVTTSTNAMAAYAVNSYLWKNVNNDSALSFLVSQVGPKLLMYNIDGDDISSGYIEAIDLSTTNHVRDPISGNSRIDFARIDGELVLVSAELKRPLRLRYRPRSPLLSQFVLGPITLNVRDIWGIEDYLPVNERPQVLTDLHKYNLLNQGWQASFITPAFFPVTGDDTLLLKDVYPDFYLPDGTPDPLADQSTGYLGESRLVYDQYGEDGNIPYRGPESGEPDSYPSNADIQHLGKKTDGTFDSTLVDKLLLGTTPAPKGTSVLDFFNRGSSRALRIEDATFPLDKETGSFSAVVGFAGRLFYSGLQSEVEDPDPKTPRVGGALLYSKLIESSSDYGVCHQVADPTSEDFSELVATDGGFVNITEATNIQRLVTLNRKLVVLAENGVWSISGPDGVFRADDFNVTKITDTGLSSPDSVIVADDSILYFAANGVYSITYDPTSGELISTNISATTIQTLYAEIPERSRSFAKGFFDGVGRRVRWLYSSEDVLIDGYTFRYRFDSELVLDLVLGSWYKNKTTFPVAEDGSTVYIAGYAPTEEYVVADYEHQIVVGGDPVQVNGEDVVYTERVRAQGSTETRYLTVSFDDPVGEYNLSFSYTQDSDFVDWKCFDGVGVDAPAFLLTGHSLWNDTQRQKSTNYITVHHERTETGFVENPGGGLDAVGSSGCLMQARWDFANSAASGKWGRQIQTYRLKRTYIPDNVNDPFDYGWEVITTKSRVRGSGRALSLKFETEPNKDLILLGWGLEVLGETEV